MCSSMTKVMNRWLNRRQLDELVAWLNPKGVRELALKNILTKWWPHIAPGIRKRITVRSTFHVLSTVY